MSVALVTRALGEGGQGATGDTGCCSWEIQGLRPKESSNSPEQEGLACARPGGGKGVALLRTWELFSRCQRVSSARGRQRPSRPCAQRGDAVLNLDFVL